MTVKRRIHQNAKTEKADPIGRLLAESRPTADSETLLADLIEAWGGTKLLALDIRNEFSAAGKGGMTRQRILEMVQRLIITNTTHDIGRATSPSDMDDEDLEVQAARLLKRINDNAAAASSAPGTG